MLVGGWGTGADCSSWKRNLRVVCVVFLCPRCCRVHTMFAVVVRRVGSSLLSSSLNPRFTRLSGVQNAILHAKTAGGLVSRPGRGKSAEPQALSKFRASGPANLEKSSIACDSSRRQLFNRHIAYYTSHSMAFTPRGGRGGFGGGDRGGRGGARGGRGAPRGGGRGRHLQTRTLKWKRNANTA